MRMRVHESHYAGRAIINFRYFFWSTQIRVIKKIFVCFQDSVFHAHIKGVSERSELMITPCYILILQLCVCVSVRAGGHRKST